MGCVTSKSQKVFEIPLVDVPRHDDHALLPKIVIECLRVIERAGNIDTNGIYRIAGNKSDIDKLIEKVSIEFFICFETVDWFEFEFQIEKKNNYKAIRTANVHVVTSILKTFFREMKSNLIPTETSKYLLNQICMWIDDKHFFVN